MLKHKLLLADGTVLTSGESTGSAIRSVTLTEQVNNGDDLCPGAACAAFAEIELWVPENSLPIHQGETLTLVRVDTAAGTETPAGVFLAEKPTRTSANVCTLTAYDRMTLFDRDLTQWLEEQQKDFPLTLARFVENLCAACGVTLEPGTLDDLPNGGYEIRPFAADSITGRQLLQWAAQAAGRFARMTPSGNLELAWYEETEGLSAVAAPQEGVVPAGVRLSGSVLRTAAGQVWRIAQKTGYYLQDSLRYEDYDTAPVDKVQLKQSEADVGMIWPPEETGDNALVISGNLLLTTDSAARLKPVARTLFEQISRESYTPLRLTLTFDEAIRPGTRLDVVDPYGQVHHTLVMKRTVSGQTMQLESTGHARRDSTIMVNRQSYKDLQGKVMEMQTTVDGLSIHVQQDFPGNRLESVNWRSGHSGSTAGGSVILNGRHAVLQGDGTGSCGAVVEVPDEFLDLMPGADLDFTVQYRVTSPITILDPQVLGAYIRAFAEYEEDGSQKSAWVELVRVAWQESPAAECGWTTVSARMRVPSVPLKRIYLFANIQSGTGTLEVEEPGAEITSAKITALRLNAGAAELSSARIALTGMVEFNDLEESGRTVINGGNITTGIVRSSNGALTIDLDNAALVAGNNADLRAGSAASYTKFLWNGFNSYTDGELRSGIENNWNWFNRTLTALFSTSGLTGVGYKNAAGQLQMGYTYDPYSDIQSGFVNYINGSEYCTDVSSARIQRCRYQMYLENSVGGANDGQIQAYDSAVTVYNTNFHCVGNISCGGAKNRIVATGHYGSRALNAMESAAALFCDSGSGQLDDTGVCLLVIHPVLEECLDPYARPQWLVTGAAPGFWVEKQGRTAMVHGPAGAEFDWMLLAPQRGYADCYADPVPTPSPVPDGLGEAELEIAQEDTARRTRELDGLTDAVAAEWAQLEEMEESA